MTELAIQTATPLKPGDKVLITLRTEPPGSRRKLDEMVDALEERFPGVQFTVLWNVVSVSVDMGGRACDGADR